jgi:hypothetical protein
MSGPLIVLAIVIAIGAIYVLLPVALTTYASFRQAREVLCPDANAAASIRLDAKYAAAMSAIGASKLRIMGCSRWPERGDCGRACLSQIPR